MTIYCSQCGKQIPSNAKFCPYCGEEVILNRNNPDAVEISIDEIKEAEFEEVNQEVVDTPISDSEQPRGSQYSEQDIEKYRREIEACKAQRKKLLIPGIILAGIGFVAAFVVIILAMVRGYQIGTTLGGATLEEMIVIIEQDWYIRLYSLLSSIFSLVLDAGVVLIILGAIVNGVKIGNREKIINGQK